MHFFTINNWNFIKLIPWGWVSFMAFPACIILLFCRGILPVENGCQKVHEGALSRMDLILIGATVALFCAVIFFVVKSAIRMVVWIFKKYQEKHEWKGIRAEKKIRGLTQKAKEVIRTKYEYNGHRTFDKTDPAYVELRKGNFIITGFSSKTDPYIEFELASWVSDCLKGNPQLVQELPDLGDFEKQCLDFV